MTNENSNPGLNSGLNVDTAVRDRYARAARAAEPALCCPVDYRPEYLAPIPQEVIERDYGCGDPSRYVAEGETVLDLGSGAGKIAFISSQVVGPGGKVIGVDMNDEMLALARRSAPVVASRIGYGNVAFHKGKIQDLRLNRDRVDVYLREHPVGSEQDYQRLEAFMEQERRDRPLCPDSSIDVVLSNCVLNLVEDTEKHRLFDEIYRVLKPGGRAVISDIVSDEPVPAALKADPDLWSGCVSGAFQEEQFLNAFERAGFYGITLAKWEEKPWRTVAGIDFRAVTVVAYKGKEAECRDHRDAVIYRGPFRSVVDDDGHTFPRGQRVAVCHKTFGILSQAPYTNEFVLAPPLVPTAEEGAPPFPCTAGVRKRDPRESKGEDYRLTIEAGSCC